MGVALREASRFLYKGKLTKKVQFPYTYQKESNIIKFFCIISQGKLVNITCNVV